MKQTVISVNSKEVNKKIAFLNEKKPMEVNKTKYGGYKNPPSLFPVVSEVNSLGDSKPIKQETKPMSRQVPSLLNLSNTSSVAAPSTVTVESLGVTSDFTTLEIRATLKPGAKKQTLFTFHGGSVMKSKKGNLFTAFMLRPFIYSREGNKDILVNNETGELQHSSVKSLLVKGVDQTIPADIEPIVSMLKAAPEAQRELAIGMLRTQPALDIDTILSYLNTGSTLVHKEVSPAKLLNSLFKHENVRFKANISSKWENKIDSIIDRISGGDDKYSIILRFDLSKVNAIKELVEVQHYLEDGSLAARLHPITGDVVQLQEVSIALTYIGLEKGSTYDEDTSKYLNPSLVINAALSATKDVENPVYMDYSIIEARAEKVNAWKANMAKFTGKKFLQNSGILVRLFDELPQLVMMEVPGARDEVDSIFKTLKEDERISEVKYAELGATYLRKVREAANLPEPSENTSTSESTAEQVESQEETPSVTEEAVDLLSSPAFSLDALLGMNLAIDEE